MPDESLRLFTVAFDSSLQYRSASHLSLLYFLSLIHVRNTQIIYEYAKIYWTTTYNLQFQQPIFL